MNARRAVALQPIHLYRLDECSGSSSQLHRVNGVLFITSLTRDVSGKHDHKRHKHIARYLLRQLEHTCRRSPPTHSVSKLAVLRYGVRFNDQRRSFTKHQWRHPLTACFQPVAQTPITSLY